MTRTITNRQTGIRWGAKGTERIAQNVQNLLGTYHYEVAYDRLLGLDPALIDRPSPQATAQLQVQVRDLIRRFEPRATVKDVQATISVDGELLLEVSVDL